MDQPFKRQPHKRVKHTQTICRQDHIQQLQECHYQVQIF